MLNLLFISFLHLFFNFGYPADSSRYHITIEEYITVKINGNSNINKFSLEYREPLAPKKIKLGNRNNDKIAVSGDTKISLRINSFTSSQKLVLRDFKKMVNSEEIPTIEINLLNYNLNLNKALMTANVNIGGSWRLETFPVTVSKIDNNRYTVSSTHSISLKNYNLTPPQKIMGAIVVNDDVTININFSAKISGT